MEYLANKGVPCGVSEIARDLKIPKNSVFRILFTLTECNFVRQIEQEYQISSKLLTLGHRIVGGSTLLEKSLPLLRELRNKTRETVGFGILTPDHRGIVLEQISGLEPIRIQIEVGYQFPLHTAAPGKVFLAFLPEERREAVISALSFDRMTKNTILSMEDYRRELEEVRRLGYALDREEQIDHVFCIGAPVFNHKAEVLAAVWITGPVFRISGAEVSRLAAIVKQTTLEISRRAGFHMTGM